MLWRLRAIWLALLVLCLPAPAAVAAQALNTQAEWNTAVRQQLQRRIVTPPAALRADRNLRVQVRIDIQSDGTIDAVSVSQSSGDPGVDNATVAMIRRAGRLPAFTPDMAADKQSVTLPIQYVTEGGETPAAAPAQRREYANAALGFSFSVPAPYTLRDDRHPSRYDLQVDIGSAQGGPPAVRPDSVVCTVAYRGIAAAKTSNRRPLPSPEARADRLDTRSGTGRYTAVYNTPQARVTLTCATTRDALAAALPAFRQIRDSINVAPR